MTKNEKILEALIMKYPIAHPNMINARKQACKRSVDGFLYLDFKVGNKEYGAALSPRELTVYGIGESDDKALNWNYNHYGGRDWLWLES